MSDATSAAVNSHQATTLLDHAPIAIVALDGADTITAWNARAEQLFGYSAAEAISKNVRTLLSFQALSQSVEPDAESPTITSCRHKDGRRIECEWEFASLGTDGDAPGNKVAVIRDIGAKREKDRVLQRNRAVLQSIIKGPPLVLWACDKAGAFTLSEGQGLQGLGLAPGQVVGSSVFDVYAGNDVIIDGIYRTYAGEFVSVTSEAGNRFWDSHMLPLRNDAGEIEGIVGLAWDITPRLEAERELRAKLSLIEAHENTIRTLSTTIVRVWKEVLALPLVGNIDERRAEQIMSSLLDAVVKEQAQYVILDMTGIVAVDASTAEQLLRVMRAVGLLGASAIITGIKPAVAQTMVELGVDVGSLSTLANLEDALRYVMKRRDRQR